MVGQRVGEKRTDLKTFEDYKKKSLMLDVPYDEFMSRVERLTESKGQT
jgi:arsenite oxidase large subunit